MIVITQPSTTQGLELSVLPVDVPTDALVVNLYGRKITKIKANVFAQLSRCWRLRLDYNLISEIEPGAFNGLKTVSELTLTYNRLQRLKANMFSGLSSCKLLRLRGNQISGIDRARNF